MSAFARTFLASRDLARRDEELHRAEQALAQTRALSKARRAARRDVERIKREARQAREELSSILAAY